MSVKAFVDTNIWVYAKLVQPDQQKHQKAVFFLKDNTDQLFISTQVINEFYSVLNKNHISDPIIQESILQILPEINLQMISIDTLKKSWEIKLKYQYSIYDSLIIASALEAGCSKLYSEDLQHNQLIGKKLRIINPFVE